MLKQGLVAFGALAIVGCGGGDPLSEGDAQIAWEATQGGMGGAGSTPSGISATTPCADGGNVKWKYSLFDGFGVTGGGGVEVEYTIIFKGCKNDGVKIGGRMTYTISTFSDADGSNVTWGYEGELRYSGDIKGSCEYKMLGQVGADSTGASVSWEGSICGHDAGATLNVTNGNVTNNVDGSSVTVTTDPV